MNMCTLLEVSMTEVRKEILKGIRECAERGLIQTTKWLSELNFSLKHIKVEDEPMALNYNSTACDEQDSYMLAKSYFDCQEYDRAAHFLENCVTPKCTFLHRYSQYMSSEKKRLDNLNDNGNDISDTNQAQVLLDLLSYYKTNRNNLDGYGLYLYGVVLNKLDLRTQALDVLQEAVNAAPWLWGAWVELSTLISSMEMMESLQLPRHWMLYFFIGHTFVELKLTEQALETYDRLQNVGFGSSNYVNAQLAVIHHDRRDVETSLNLFRELFQADPYRLENWDVYSHLLYVKEKKMELANLAQRAISIDKYRVETCCVIGNYYSLRNEYEKAVVYFQRALSLDPQYLTAWILMGHEFVELQNSNAAIQCYRQAIDVNRNDYRAWNGLGQAYEILGLNGYCVYYYARAAQLRPYDSRMLVSLGQAYEKMDKIPNALKCYHRAHSTGDIEGMALFKLAKLYEKLSMTNSAAAAFTAACQGATTQNKELPSAYRYLTYYHLKLGLLDYAAHYAYKCLEYAETKEEGKALLKTISEKRATTAQSSKSGLECSPAEEEPPLSQSMFMTPITNAPPPANAPPPTNANASSGSPSSLVRKQDARYKM